MRTPTFRRSCDAPTVVRMFTKHDEGLRMGVTRLHSVTELAARAAGGIEIRLLWNRNADELRVSVHDTLTGAYFELIAPREKALDVFHHPYAYAATRGTARERARSALSDSG